MKKVELRFWRLDDDSKRKTTVRFKLSNILMPIIDFIDEIDIKPFTVSSKILNGRHVPCWYTELISDAVDIEEPIAEMIERITPNLGIIERICRERSAEASFEIIVRAEYSESPILRVGPDFYPILRRLNAKFTVDYDYWW